MLNQLTANIELSENCINEAVSSFTSILKDTADQYFVKTIRPSHTTCFVDSPTYKHADWFDNECFNARKTYLEALRVFNDCNSEASRLHFCECKSNYKKIIRKKKYIFKIKKLQDIENLKRSKPKEFWKHFKKKNTKVENSLPIEDFFDYFSNLEDDIFTCRNDECEHFCQNQNFNNSSINDEFDRPISSEEILQAVKRLKTNKAYGIDCLLNEYFIETIDIILPYVCDILMQF